MKMKVTIDLKKSVEENASFYYGESKKAKKKLEGLKKACEKTEWKIGLLERKKEKALEEFKEKREKTVVQRKREWYEKFRWFYSSEGFLCIGGRDATTNEIIIKKHTEKDDLVFHTEIPGSPFFVIKAEGKKPGESTINEAAQATASYSRAWKMGMASAEVYYIKPEQVSKTAPAGQHMGKGSFMIYGKRTYLSPEVKLAIGAKNGRIIGGPVDAVKKNAEEFMLVSQGRMRGSDAAKKIREKLGGGLEEIQAFLPAGEIDVEQKVF